MTVAYTFFAIQALSGSSSFWKKLLILLLAPILAPIAIPLMTVGYIVIVAYVFFRKFVQPEYTPDGPGNGQMAGRFKLLEGVLEANFQAVLGLFTCLVLFKAWKIAFKINLSINMENMGHGNFHGECKYHDHGNFQVLEISMGQQQI